MLNTHAWKYLIIILFYSLFTILQKVKFSTWRTIIAAKQNENVWQKRQHEENKKKQRKKWKDNGCIFINDDKVIGSRAVEPWRLLSLSLHLYLKKKSQKFILKHSCKYRCVSKKKWNKMLRQWWWKWVYIVVISFYFLPCHPSRASGYNELRCLEISPNE